MTILKSEVVSKNSGRAYVVKKRQRLRVVGRMIVDACRPYEHLDSFPPVAASSPELLSEVWAKWGHLFEKDKPS